MTDAEWEAGHARANADYAREIGMSVEQMRAKGISSVKCRCRPGSSTPHCGGFRMVLGHIESARMDDGTTVRVYISDELTSPHAIPQTTNHPTS